MARRLAFSGASYGRIGQAAEPDKHHRPGRCLRNGRLVGKAEAIPDRACDQRVGELECLRPHAEGSEIEGVAGEEGLSRGKVVRAFGDDRRAVEGHFEGEAVEAGPLLNCCRAASGRIARARSARR